MNASTTTTHASLAEIDVFHVPTQYEPLLTCTELTALIETANREHRSVERASEEVHGALVAAVTHALEAGDALLRARAFVPEGDWAVWAARNLDCHVDTAGQYIRLAAYRAEVEQWLAGAAKDIRSGAAKGGFVRAALRAISPPKRALHDEAIRAREEAAQMRRAGMSYRAIGATLGVRHSTVQLWLDPAYRQRQQALQKVRRRRYRQARQALRREEQQREIERMIKASGESAVADLYGQVRRAAQKLDAVVHQADGVTAPHLRNALSELHRAEDYLVSALRAERTQRDGTP